MCENDSQTAPCAICAEPAEYVCTLCQDPACDDHLIGYLCATCEDADE